MNPKRRKTLFRFTAFIGLFLILFYFNYSTYEPLPLDLSYVKTERIVVSITTFGGRIMALEKTIISLMKQTVVPDVIYLHIPLVINRIESPKIDPLVLDFPAKYPAVNISIQHPKDYGPSTKLLGALLIEHDPQTIVITLDDDTEYHPSTIFHLVNFMKSNNDLAPCFVCEYWFFGGSHRKISTGLCHGWANAYAGVAYRVGWFGNDVFDYSDAPKGCLLHDDVWISGILSRQKIYPALIKPGFTSVMSHFRHSNLSINSVQNGERNHRDPCIQHFNYFN